MNPQKESGSDIAEASSPVNQSGAWEAAGPRNWDDFKYSESYA